MELHHNNSNTGDKLPTQKVPEPPQIVLPHEQEEVIVVEPVPAPPKAPEPNMPSPIAPQPLRELKQPKPLSQGNFRDKIPYEGDKLPQAVSEAMFKLPKKWLKEMQKAKEEKDRLERLARLPPPRSPDHLEEKPLRKACYTDFYLAYEMAEQGSPYRLQEQIMMRPAPKFKPKKVSAEEPASIPLENFANLDELPQMYGASFEISDRRNPPAPELPMEPLEVPEPEPPMQEMKPKKEKKQKKESKR